MLTGDRIVSGIREIWVRDVYLNKGYLAIKDGDRVADLGCSKGNFTIVALAHGPAVRTVSVEVQAGLLRQLRDQISCNGFEGRVEIVNAFIGRDRQQSEKLRSAISEDTILTELITENDLIDRCSIDRIDLLKCDIEGSEFDLPNRDSRLLALSNQFAIELHKNIGDAEAFVAMLHDLGFETRRTMENKSAVVISARRRPGDR